MQVNILCSGEFYLSRILVSTLRFSLMKLFSFLLIFLDLRAPLTWVPSNLSSADTFSFTSQVVPKFMANCILKNSRVSHLEEHKLVYP